MDYIKELLNFIEIFKNLQLNELNFNAGKYNIKVRKESEKKIVVEITEI